MSAATRRPDERPVVAVQELLVTKNDLACEIVSTEHAVVKAIGVARLHNLFFHDVAVISHHRRLEYALADRVHVLARDSWPRSGNSQRRTRRSATWMTSPVELPSATLDVWMRKSWSKARLLNLMRGKKHLQGSSNQVAAALYQNQSDAAFLRSRASSSASLRKCIRRSRTACARIFNEEVVFEHPVVLVTGMPRRRIVQRVVPALPFRVVDTLYLESKIAERLVGPQVQHLRCPRRIDSRRHRPAMHRSKPDRSATSLA